MNKSTSFAISMGAILLVLVLSGCQGPEQAETSQQTQTTAPQQVAEPQTQAQTQTDQAAATQKVKIQSTLEAPITTNVIEKKPQSSPQTINKNFKTAGAALKGIIIRVDGFAPSSITISSGTTIIFSNMDENLHWPASGVHPTHEICPGFDALKGLAKGETYAFTFTEIKTCPFHDHLNPSLKGTIVVK